MFPTIAKHLSHLANTMEELFLLFLLALTSGFVMFSQTKQLLAFHLKKVRFASSTSEFGDFEDEDLEEDEEEHHSSKHGELDFHAIRMSSEKVYSSLSHIREYVLRDFINSWYIPSISKHPGFPEQVRITIDYAFSSLAELALDVDWPSFLMEDAVVYLTDQIRYFRFSEQQMMKRYPKYQELSADQRKVLLLGEIFRNYQLHEGASNPDAFLRKLSSKLVKNILRRSDYSCKAVRCLLIEVFTCSILAPVMEFTTPFWINVGINQAVSKGANREHKYDESVFPDGDDEDIDGFQGSFNDSSDEDLEALEKRLFDDAFSEEEVPFPSPSLSSLPKDYVDLKITPSYEESTMEEYSLGASASASSYQVSVTGWTYAYDNSHRPYVLYKLDVRHQGERWGVWKRYSNFTDLHQKLQRIVPTFRAKLPKKKFLDLFESMDKRFIKQRAVDLNNYLNHGILFNTQCTESWMWTEFLEVRKHRKQSSGTAKSVFNESSGGRTLREPLRDKTYGPELTKPLYDFVGEIFELEKRGWVQRQIGWIATAALQSFDRSLSKTYAAKFSELTHEDSIAGIIDSITELVWPNGKLVVGQPPPSDAEVHATEQEARRNLEKLLPSVLTTLLGSEFCESRFAKLHTFLQLEPVVKHLAFTLLEKVFTRLLRQKKRNRRHKS